MLDLPQIPVILALYSSVHLIIDIRHNFPQKAARIAQQYRSGKDERRVLIFREVLA